MIKNTLIFLILIFISEAINLLFKNTFASHRYTLELEWQRIE